MNKLIRKFSPTIELLIILILGFGLFIYSSTISFFAVNSDYTHSWGYKITNFSHSTILIYEVIAFSIILYILKVRAWRLTDFNLSFKFRLIWVALLLLVLRNITGGILSKIFEFATVIGDTGTKHVHYGLEANWIVILLFVVINSIYEEFILVGYFFKRLEKYHPAILIGLSTLIRLSFHTYQGWIGIFYIIPTGLIFGYYYFKYKKLWPLIIAHGLMNLLVFLRMQFQWQDN
ncbi:CPBP family intramembrane glutamic endopeptidase [uncultured Sunxiuqinia sp.]|uniref:CPBP family intramembrane glutamic endopeptidase n=1 Tax=uncultured Sunxiuqinia sp. TaxID=1573825 RepID=UPI00263854B9|nr:CPBP family intramembrane glutamic endopeptidase [uncultured Sunxiuqinia sp.]